MESQTQRNDTHSLIFSVKAVWMIRQESSSKSKYDIISLMKCVSIHVCEYKTIQRKNECLKGSAHNQTYNNNMKIQRFANVKQIVSYVK